MTDSNYPDILGYITGGDRLNVSVVQVALAVRPRVSRAGRPFEAILLIQNASDADVDVTATLQLPELDAKKQKKRFITKTERLVVGLRPAEVGYVVLPLSTLPDTAISEYKLGMLIEVKPLAKPRRVRLPEGGGEVVIEHLPDESRDRVQELKKLIFSTTKRGLVGTILETDFGVMGGQIGQIPDFKPGWISLWKMSDFYKDERLLVRRYGDVMLLKVLPQLKRQKLVIPLSQITRQRFNTAGYAVKPIEIHYLTKLLITILEMSAPREDTFDYLAEGAHLNIHEAIRKANSGGSGAVTLPSWGRAMLRAIDQNPQVADHAVQMIASKLYDELLRDAVGLSFKMIKTVTGAELGSDDDMREYGERLIATIFDPNKPLTFTELYLPLVIGGVILYDRVILPDEKLGESLVEIAQALTERADERNPDTDLVFELAEKVIDQALQKYGYRQ